MKRVYIYFFLCVIAVSCSKNDSADNVAVVRKMFEAFNVHDWEKMAGFYSEHARFLDPSFGKEYVSKSRRETIEKYSGYQQMMPDIHDEIVGIYSSGDKVVVEFVSTGTIVNGPSFKLPIVSVLTINNGLIVTDATYYDVE